jgi:hypothetical protein
MRLKRKLKITTNPKTDPEKIEEWLEQAIEDEDTHIMDILYNIFTDKLYDLFEEKTLDAILYNKFAPSFYWSGDVKRWDEYEGIIDEIYKEEGKAQEIIIDHIYNNIEDYFTEDEIEEAMEYYGRDWQEQLAYNLYEDWKEKNLLNRWIEIIAPKVKEDVKKKKVDITSFIDEFFHFDFVEDAFKDYLKNESPLQIINDAKKYGYYNELVKVLKLKYG